METNSAQTVTLTNSIIGVGILSMPFCFQKCGIVLSILLLMLSGYLTRLVCSYMVKSAIISRRKNFEQIAFYAFGSAGKLLVELCVVGYLLGTCVAYFVVVGDLGPQITAKILSVSESSTLRSWVMIVVTLVCIIPLGMLRNVDSLSTICTASLGFYLCLVLKVISESREQILQPGWFDRLDMWKTNGILQCLPIFTMALSCQMQIFEVYATMPTTSLDKMSRVIQQSTNICIAIYIAIGFFGYVAFNGHRFSGNILVDFSPSFVSDVIKIGFVLSVAFSFPLVIFPCRVSLYSLLFKRTADAHFYIPESKFRPLTLAIVLVALFVGLLIPSIEVVIGLVGSTIGVAICLIIPAACYMTICKTNISEKQLAQVMIGLGFIIMLLGTYANLQAIDNAPERKYDMTPSPPPVVGEKPIEMIAKLEKQEPKKPPPPPPPEQPMVTEKIVPKIEQPPVTEKQPEPKEVPEVPPAPPREIINKDAIQKEENEIAIEEKDKIEQQISELKSAKKALEEQVKDIKEQLVQNNVETQKLVLKKFDEIAEKIEQNAAIKVSRENEQNAMVKNPSEGLAVYDAAKQEPPPETQPKPKDPIPVDDPIVKLLTGGNNKTAPEGDTAPKAKPEEPVAVDKEARGSVQDNAPKVVPVETKAVESKDAPVQPPLPVERLEETVPKKEVEDDAGGGAKRDLLGFRQKRETDVEGIKESNCRKDAKSEELL